MMRRPPGIPLPPMPLPGQISNVTNSNDMSSKESRVFVGNLNTFALKKEDLDAIFHRYGIVTGISMHKGYAFIQYSHPAEARRAVAFENGQMYAGQPLDLNIVAEPKHRPAQKRPGTALGKHDGMGRVGMRSSTAMPPMKRPKQENVNPSLQRTLVTLSNSSRPNLPVRKQNQTAATKTAAAAVKRATATVSKAATAKVGATPVSKVSTITTEFSSSPNVITAVTSDVLICGVCKLQFTSLHSLAQHKKVPCRLRMSCQCQTNPPQHKENDPGPLECASCDARFDNAWSLCQHFQSEHKISIYKTEGAVANSKLGEINSENAKESDEADKSVDKHEINKSAEEDAKKEVKKAVVTTPNKK